MNFVILLQSIYFILNRITELHGGKLNEICLFFFQQSLDTYTGKGAILQKYPNITTEDWNHLSNLSTILNAVYSPIETPISRIPTNSKIYGIHIPYVCPNNGTQMNQITEDDTDGIISEKTNSMTISEVKSQISAVSNSPTPINNVDEYRSQDFLNDLLTNYIIESNLNATVDELSKQVIQILESSPNAEVLQEPLVNLLGFNFDIIQTIIESRDYILESRSMKFVKPVFDPSPVILPQYSVTTESEIKQMKEQHKKWKKQKNMEKDALINSGINPRLLQNEYKLGLNKYMPKSDPYTPYLPGVHLDDTIYNKTVLPASI